MRLRVEAVVCLFLAILLTGCRNGLDSGAINDLAPETWITAAPQDTATIKNSSGVVITPGTPGLIPVRFHVYWAGSDRDGAVSGFYWAVTETLAVPVAPGFPLPPLPGPKLRDYHFTTRTDSIFTFTADISVPDRYHTFYVFAVDDKGKADPTPARFTFRAYDRFPPLGVFDEASATGIIYQRNPGGGVTPVVVTKTITDTFVVTRSYPADTVASGSVLTFRWHAEPRAAGMVASGYQYKLDEPVFNVVDSSVHVATYNTGIGLDVLAPGTKKFTLRTVGESGWRSEATRFFQINYAPDGWFSGPNLADPQWTSYTDNNGYRYWYRDVSWGGLATGGLPGTLISGDSISVLPADRPERRTFFEFYKDRVWAHQEGDTVNLNSWVVMPSGGTDPDSRYAVHIGVDPSHPVGVVTTPGPANGSPVGFRYLVAVRKASGQILSPSESSLYPVFDMGSVFHSPKINCYAPMSTTGKCYLYTAAEDGDGSVDRRIQRAGGPAKVAEDVDANNGDPYENAVRTKVMVFYVNHRPYLKTGDGAFLPVPGASYQRGSLVALNIIADDLDPIDYTRTIDRVGGPQPGAGTLLVRSVDVRGTNVQGRDTTISVASAVEFANVTFIMPVELQPGAAHVLVTVCDYRPTDAAAGNVGRCSDTLDVPITITGPGPALPTTGASQSTSRPGFTATDGRRQQP